MGTRIILIALFFVASGCASTPEQKIDYSNEERYAFSYCLAEAYAGSEVAGDARYIAGVYLEKGEAGIDAYERIRTFVDEYRKEPYASKYDRNLSIMQCLDLLGSQELARVL